MNIPTKSCITDDGIQKYIYSGIISFIILPIEWFMNCLILINIPLILNYFRFLTNKSLINIIKMTPVYLEMKSFFIISFLLFLLSKSLQAAHIRGLSRLYINTPSRSGYVEIIDVVDIESLEGTTVDASALIYIPNPETEVIDPNWLIPCIQFEFSIPIYSAIFLLSNIWDAKGFEYQIGTFSCILSIIVCVQCYFGYFLFLSIHYEPCFYFKPVLNRIAFPNTGPFVPYSRWAIVPLSWITQCLLLIPEDKYTNLEKSYHFPNRIILFILFTFQLLHFMGLYDRFISFLTTSNQNQ